MSMKDDPKKQALLDRVRKCLALAERAGTEGEAAAAAERAQAILAEHNLELSEVFAEKPEFVIDKELVTKSDAWMRRVALGTASLYFCSYFYFHRYPEGKKGVKSKRRDVHNFVGAPHNVMVAKMMFEYLTATAERLAAEGAKKVLSSERSSYVTSFTFGCSSRLCKRLFDRMAESRRQETKTETGTTLPALANLYDTTKVALDNFMSANVGKLREKKSTMKTNNMQGYFDGRDAGDSISLDTQVSGRGDSKQIGSTKLIGR